MFVAWVFHLWPRTWGKMMQNHCLFEVIVHDDFHKMHLYELAIYWITQRICHGVTCIAERWVGQGWFGEFEGVLWELCAGGVHQDGPTISRMWFPEWFKATRDNLEWLYSLKQACHVKMDPWKKQIQNKTWYLGSTLVFQSVSYSNCWWLFFCHQQWLNMLLHWQVKTSIRGKLQARTSHDFEFRSSEFTSGLITECFSQHEKTAFFMPRRQAKSPITSFVEASELGDVLKSWNFVGIFRNLQNHSLKQWHIPGNHGACWTMICILCTNIMDD